jgi:hypothetical protein
MREGRNHHDSHHEDFIAEERMQENFTKMFKGKHEAQPQPKPPFKKWFQAGDHHPFTYNHYTVIPGGIFNCETITDEWYQWFLSTPKQSNPFANPGSVSTDRNSYSGANAFLFDKRNTLVYFTTASPFQKPDFRTVVMTRNAPLLVPVYNVVASPALYTMKTEEEYVQFVTKDLGGIREDTVEAKFDGEFLYGCSVIRKKPLKIYNVPKDNVLAIPENRLIDTNYSIDVYHGGFWLLIKEEKITPGDHFLSFKAHSINYEMEANILISALVGEPEKTVEHHD